jgi:hypothetical protein
LVFLSVFFLPYVSSVGNGEGRHLGLGFLLESGVDLTCSRTSIATGREDCGGVNPTLEAGLGSAMVYLDLPALLEDREPSRQYTADSSASIPRNGPAALLGFVNSPTVDEIHPQPSNPGTQIQRSHWCLLQELQLWWVFTLRGITDRREKKGRESAENTAHSVGNRQTRRTTTRLARLITTEITIDNDTRKGLKGETTRPKRPNSEQLANQGSSRGPWRG